MGVGKDLSIEKQERYNKRDPAGMATLFADDAVFVDSSGRYEGREAILAYLEALFKSFNGWFEPGLVIEEGDTVVAEWIWRATHAGPIAMPDGSAIPATGRTVEVPGVSVITVKDEKLSSQRDYFDNAAVMTRADARHLRTDQKQGGELMCVGKELWTELDKKFNDHDVSGIASCYASDAVYTDPTGRYEGREGIMAYFEQADKPFSDISQEIFRLIEEGDTVVAEWIWRATNTAQLTMPDVARSRLLERR
jgi:steroid delta-isomerase-like uncharacterized protein